MVSRMVAVWFALYVFGTTHQSCEANLFSNFELTSNVTLHRNTTDVHEGSGYETRDEDMKVQTNKWKKRLLKCPFMGRNVPSLSSRNHELSCCKAIINGYKSKWFERGHDLNTHFQKLKQWRCPQFKMFCKKGLYGKFSVYSNLVYLYHCNATAFQDQCGTVISSARGLPSNAMPTAATENMTSSEFSLEALGEPCVQVALYGSASGGYGFYREIIDVFIPFCDISWCGFDAKAIDERRLSSWTCMSSTCRTSLVISCVVCSVLALAIILANVTVIIVFTTSPKLRNSQAVYKISLAIADLLVGFFVIPTFISSLMLLYKSRTSMGEVMANGTVNSDGMAQRNPGEIFYQKVSSKYLDFVGFFTILSITVSIYTLMMASCDRFMAIHQPLRYGRHNAKRMATWASLVLWVVAILFSALPFVVHGIGYGLVASILVTSTGELALFLYAAILLIPLLFVWISNLATYISTKRHARKRQTLTVRRSNSGGSSPISNMEARLARTLASMVGIFTLSFLPATIVLIVPHSLSNLYPTKPDEFSPYASKAYLSTEFVAILILMTNSLWNCFIYNARSEDFKTTVKRLYRRFLFKVGIGFVWGKTRKWASSTFRSGRGSVSAPGPASSRTLREKFSKHDTLRTVASNHGCSASKPRTSNSGKSVTSTEREAKYSTANSGFFRESAISHRAESTAQRKDEAKQFSASHTTAVV